MEGVGLRKPGGNSAALEERNLAIGLKAAEEFFEVDETRR